MMSSSETIFYTMSIYFMTVKVKKDTLDTGRGIGSDRGRDHGQRVAGWVKEEYVRCAKL